MWYPPADWGKSILGSWFWEKFVTPVFEFKCLCRTDDIHIHVMCVGSHLNLRSPNYYFEFLAGWYKLIFEEIFNFQSSKAATSQQELRENQHKTLYINVSIWVWHWTWYSRKHCWVCLNISSWDRSLDAWITRHLACGLVMQWGVNLLVTDFFFFKF